MTPHDYEQLLPYATQRQAEYIQAMISEGNQTLAAEALGISRRSLERGLELLRRKALTYGVGAVFQTGEPIPTGYRLRGVSQLCSGSGDVQLEWRKYDAGNTAQQAHDLFDALREDLPKLAPRPAVKSRQSDLLNLFVFTDHHFGMLAWAEECGEDYDTHEAERLLLDWFAAAIRQAPPADKAVLCSLGDLLHYDSMVAETPTGRNPLDSDTRFPFIVRVVTRTLRRCVEMLLDRFPAVHILLETGNHDISSTVWLRQYFADVYSQEPRITVEISPDVYHCVEWGDVTLFTHHGHKRKVGSVTETVVAKFRDEFGRTKHSYCHTGHLHHRDLKENSLLIVEQHQTLAAADAHASLGGWLSGRSATVITYHKAYGEVARLSISPAMLGGQQ